MKRPLWTCPKCGLKFVTRNLWHSCGYATIDDWFARLGPRGRALYDRLESLIARCGDYHVSPAKTRIAFLGRVRFASISKISNESMTFGFALPRPLKSHRFVTVVEAVPGWWQHRLHITEPSQLDADVQRWLRESYRLMGQQERLIGRGRRPHGRPRSAVNPTRRAR